MKVKENVYTCGTCKHYNADEYYCELHEAPYYSKWDTCDGWTDPDEVEPTDDEKREIIGDLEYHRKVVED